MLAQAPSARRIETFLVTTITRWNASSQPSCSSISSARPSSSPRAIPRSCGGVSTRSSSTSRTASRRTAGSWRSSPATPSWPRSASRRRTRTTPSARSAPPPAILDSVHGLGLEARIGVEAGEVVADESDSTFATGEAVNVAARLQQIAQPGEILVGPFARRLTIGAVETEEVGPGRAEGLRRAADRLAAGPAAGDRRPRRLGRGALRRPRVRARVAREHARTRDPQRPRAPVHDLRRARGRQEPPRARVHRGRRRRFGARRPLAAVRRGRHLLAARRDGQGRGRDRGRRPGPGGDLEAARPVRRRRGRRPARARRRRARGDRDRAEPAGDCVGGARVGGRARRRAAADPRLRGRPLGRGAAAGADRAPRRARQGRRR